MENTFNTEHIPLRTNEIQDTIFVFSFFYWREKILCVHIFFIRGRKFYAGFPIFPIFCKKKKDFKIRFLKCGRVVDTRRSVFYIIYIYIYIYIYNKESSHPYIHPFPLNFFFQTKKGFLR
jgi:hypothetical protein